MGRVWVAAQRGSGSVEYLGVVVVAAVVVMALVVAGPGWGEAVSAEVERTICRVATGEPCGEGQRLARGPGATAGDTGGDRAGGTGGGTGGDTGGDRAGGSGGGSEAAGGGSGGGGDDPAGGGDDVDPGGPGGVAVGPPAGGVGGPAVPAGAPGGVGGGDHDRARDGPGGARGWVDRAGGALADAGSAVAGVGRGAWQGGVAVVDGAVRGDLNQTGYDSGWLEGARRVGQGLSGLVVVGDVRDIAANIGRLVRTGGQEGWDDLGWATVGLVPIVGDGAKAIRHARSVSRVVDGATDSARAADAARVAPRAADAARAGRAFDAVSDAGRMDDFVRNATNRRPGSSRSLRDNMDRFTDVHPSFRDPTRVDAHHIVPLGHRNARDARQRLRQLGVDIDAAANGVYLPRSVRGPDGRMVSSNPNAPGVNHRRLNARSYVDDVNERISDAQTREEAVRILDEIREELLSGEFR